MDSTIACLRVVLHRVGGPPLYRTPDIWYSERDAMARRSQPCVQLLLEAKMGYGRRLVDS